MSCPGVETEQKLTERESEIERLKLEAHHQRATLHELVQRRGERTVSAVRANAVEPTARLAKKSVDVGRKAIGGLAHRLSGISHARQDRSPPLRAASTKEASAENPRAPPRKVKSMPAESSGDVEQSVEVTPTFADLCSSPALAAAPATSFADVVCDVRALNADGDGAK